MKHNEYHSVKLILRDVGGVSVSSDFMAGYPNQTVSCNGESKEECLRRLRDFHKKLGEALKEDEN